MKKVSFIIPCYNEIKTVKKIIKKILILKGIRKEIIVVDDHSTDGSREVIIKFQKLKKIKAIYHKKNSGKGACIKSAQKK